MSQPKLNQSAFIGEQQQITSVTMRMSTATHQRLKLASTLTQRTMSEINQTAIESYLQSLGIPGLAEIQAAQI